MFVSESAALAKDGLINVKSLLALQAKITKALSKFEVSAQVGTLKGAEYKGGAKVILPVKTKKEANAIKKMVTEKGAVNATLTGDAGKFRLSFSALTVADAKAIVADINKLPGVAPTPESYYVMSRKTKVEEPSAAKFNKKDVKHLTRRAIKIAERKKLSATVTPLLPIYAKGVLPAALEKEIKAAASDIKKHIAKAVKVKELVGKIREKNKTERQTAYAAVVAELTTLFGAAGIKESSIAMGQTMMGQTMYVRLPSKQVITVSLSDISAFNKARKSAEAAE